MPPMTPTPSNLRRPGRKYDPSVSAMPGKKDPFIIGMPSYTSKELRSHYL